MVPSLTVGDFNGDGALDVATATALFPGHGDGTFGPPIPTPISIPNSLTNLTPAPRRAPRWPIPVATMSKGATADPANSEGGETSLVFTRQNHLLGDHPITRGRDDSERVNRVQTFTGTSLKGPEGSVPLLRLADTAVDHSLNDDKPVSAASRAQGIAFQLGKGRVVLGEDTYH